MTDVTVRKLLLAESALRGRMVLAPILRGHAVRVKLAGLVCSLRVSRVPADGLSLIRLLDAATAVYVGPASDEQREQYLSLWPKVQLILLRRFNETDWQAVRAQDSDSRFNLPGAVGVRLCDAGQQALDTVVAAFDGTFFWYAGGVTGPSDLRADQLRAELAKANSDELEPAPPSQLAIPGLTPPEHRAYALALGLVESSADRKARRIADALRHAGAAFDGYSERGNDYVVSYRVDGVRHTSLVRSSDLSVVTSGICLSGRDNLFDLSSLVGVFREGERRSLIVQTPLRNAREAYDDDD